MSGTAVPTPTNRDIYTYLVEDRLPAGLLHAFLDLLRQRLGVPVGGVEDNEDLWDWVRWDVGGCESVSA